MDSSGVEDSDGLFTVGGRDAVDSSVEDSSFFWMVGGREDCDSSVEDSEGFWEGRDVSVAFWSTV